MILSFVGYVVLTFLYIGFVFLTKNIMFPEKKDFWFRAVLLMGVTLYFGRLVAQSLFKF